MSSNLIEIEGDFLKQLPMMKKDLEKVAQRILRKTANQTDVEIHRIVTSRKLMDIDLKDFRKTKTLMRVSDLKGGIDGMHIEIKITGRPHTSYRFFPTYVGSAKKKIWMGRVYGQAKKFYGGQAFALPGKKPLFARTSSARYPLRPVFGPRVTVMLEKLGVVPELVKFSGENLRVNLLAGMKDLKIFDP